MSEHMFSDTVGDFRLDVEYDHPKFIVTVTNINDETKTLTKELNSMFEPRFGIDVSDMDHIMETAEDLAVQLENQ